MSSAQPSETRLPRVVGVAVGDSHDPHNSSGTIAPLFAALERRGILVGRLDVALSARQRALELARSFRPGWSAWRQEFHRRAYRAHSRNSARRLEGAKVPFDLVLQPFRLFQTKGAPYALLLDTTDRLRGDWTGSAPFAEHELGFEAERSLYTAAVHVFTLPSAPVSSLVEDYGVDPGRVSVVGAGPNIEAPAEVPPSGGPGRRILFVGRDFRRKGGDHLLAAFERVRERHTDARLTVVGPVIEDPPPGVEALGDVRDRNVIAKLYRDADVFCLPSLFEPTGMSLMEAMAYGLPCVGTEVGGIPEAVIDGETGLIVPPADPGALATALDRLLGDPAMAARMGGQGRRRIDEELNWDAVVDRMLPGLEAALELGR